MTVIKFGKWDHMCKWCFFKRRRYTYDRIYKDGYKWTPFCIRKRIE